MKKNLFLSMLAILAISVFGFGGVSKADLTNWRVDRSEPESFVVKDGKISIEVSEQQKKDSWYDWQGKKADTNVDFSNTWTVKENIYITEEMLDNINTNVSVRIQVDEYGGNGAESQADTVDRSIVGFKNNGTTSTFQVFDGLYGKGWFDIEGITPKVGTYEITTTFDNGTITQYINGEEINTYNIVAENDEIIEKTHPAIIIVNARSYGESFSVDIDVPTVICPNPDVITEDFGLWGPEYPGWYNLGWRYNETFPIDEINYIEAGIKDVEGKLIVKYYTDEAQLNFQNENGYITATRQSSAPFAQSIPEIVDEDWIVVYGEAHAGFAPAKGYVIVKTENNGEFNKERDYQGTPVVPVSVETQDFGAWGEEHPSWYNLGWVYSETFPIDNISSIDVKLLNADNKLIVEYTAEGDQLTYQKDNGYITAARQSSAPFYQEYNGSIIPEGADYDWTVVYGDVNAFVEWSPAKAELTVVTSSDTYTAEATFTQEAQPSLITVVNFDSNGGSAVDSIFVIKNGTITEPAAPTQAGYIFNGWYNGDAKFDFTTAIADVTNLKAQWTKEPSRSSGGGGGSSRTPAKEDVVLKGEVDAETGDLVIVPNPNAEEDLDIVAEPEEKTEMELAYKFAFKNGITTMDTYEKANMNGTLTRIAMAKMLAQYAINVLGKTPDTGRNATFKDVTAKMDADYNSGITLAYQLGIMGINLENGNYRPNDLVTRAEFGTALSRLLYGTEDGKDNYYTTHLAVLTEKGIITNTNASLQELRGYVMIMLMRSANVATDEEANVEENSEETNAEGGNTAEENTEENTEETVE